MSEGRITIMYYSYISLYTYRHALNSSYLSYMCSIFSSSAKTYTTDNKKNYHHSLGDNSLILLQSTSNDILNLSISDFNREFSSWSLNN